VVLILFAILIAVLLVLWAFAGLLPRIAVKTGAAGLCSAIVLLAVVALASGAGIATLELPIGPSGAAMHLALDPLAANFLLLLFLVTPFADIAPLALAALAITVLADDSFTLAVGMLLLGGAASMRITAVAAVCLIVAFTLAAPQSDFALMRAAPPEGLSAAAVLLLVLAGAAALSRVNPTIAGYLVLRVVFDLCGTGQPLWWGVPLLLAGGAIAVVGSLRAALAGTLHAVLTAGSLHLFGMAAMALGVALFARAVDLPSVASQALDATWLALVCHLMCRTLLLLCANAAEAGAGTRRLDRLGGLIHSMPVTAGSCLIGLVTVAALPPGLGFAAFWLLFQSLLAAARIGDHGVQVLIVCIAPLAALSLGLTALAAVRLFGTAFLGRPRTPRTAAAVEAPRPVRFVPGGLAALAALLGLLPSLALLPFAEWTHSSDSLSFVMVRSGAEAPGYSPTAVALLLGIAVFAVLRGSRRTGEQRREPAWSGGFAAPPAYLPFGDPVTQYGPASFVEPLQRALTFLPSSAAIRRHLVLWRDAVVRAATALVVP
jgi:hydrogenase-4 component B